MSDLEIILNTCKRMEIPPNPKIKAHNIILIDIFLQGMADICFTPLVNSINPLIKPEEKSLLIPIKSKKGLIIFESTAIT